MTAESLVLPPDLSREEPAASNIHLLKPTKHDPGAILHGGSMTITNTVDAAQPRARFQQVDSLSSPHANVLSCSFFPVLPNGILTIIKAVRIFNPATGRNLRSAFDQIIGRRKLAEMNLNGGLRAGGSRARKPLVDYVGFRHSSCRSHCIVV